MYKKLKRRWEVEVSKKAILLLKSYGPFLYLCPFEYTPDAERQALGTMTLVYRCKLEKNNSFKKFTGSKGPPILNLMRLESVSACTQSITFSIATLHTNLYVL